jgi:hypothetical protein
MNRKLLLFLWALIFPITGNNLFSQEGESGPLAYSGGVFAGYNHGLAFNGNFTASKFPKGFPFELRFGIGYIFLNPGDAMDARRIFINNNTNGVPEKKGHSIDFRFDFMVSKPVFGVKTSYIVFGPRFSTFKGNFVYVGGNEDFDVTSHQWGVGLGLEHHFPMSDNLSLVVSYGLDYYIPSTLTGHDTAYSPDNDNRNPKRDNQNDDVYFVYKDANKAISQPGLVPRLMIGVSFGL